jgi:hypothetical protein
MQQSADCSARYNHYKCSDIETRQRSTSESEQGKQRHANADKYSATHLPRCCRNRCVSGAHAPLQWRQQQGDRQ